MQLCETQDIGPPELRFQLVDNCLQFLQHCTSQQLCEYAEACLNLGDVTNLFLSSKKYVVICYDFLCADTEWNIILLGCFSPIAAHPSGYIDDNRGIPKNLMPSLKEVVVATLITVFETDYPKEGWFGVCFLPS
ncbi:hypothetical protein Vadar_034404 [Vaccinium darrowii]|uniref:Uncharacterized protein n=1 Tax=Vaccinium darrowii TaxID=229202 RepID=A0ACB7XLU3_9ERIC|nr:hypothetical protein Vadar_034404 [Vaccinium darrowii]